MRSVTRHQPVEITGRSRQTPHRALVLMEATVRPILTTILAGAAALGALGASAALAGDDQMHIMTIRLPDGSVRQIQYAGDVPPQVIVAPAPVAPIGFADPFAAMRLMSAMLDRQADMMLRQAAATRQGTTDDAENAPGMRVYSMSSTIGASGVCMRSVQITYTGDAKPHVVSRSSGDCGAAAPPAEINAPRPVPAAQPKAPRTIEVKATNPRPALAMAQPAFPPQ
jgi:hypothetical protein